MRRFTLKKKVVTVGLATAIALSAGGVAFAYFTSTGAGSGAASVGRSAKLDISQLGTTVYDSTVSPPPASIPSYGAEAYAFNAIGNEITLASSMTPLSSVVVTMDSWACGVSGSGYNACVTTPGTTYPVPITLNIYNAGPGNTVGSLITSDTQTFNIPFRPSSTSNCPTGGWYDTTTSTCNHGLADNITFSNFSPATVLPSTIIYSISYSTDHYGPSPTGGSANPTDSLNVGFSTASSNVTVGSDAFPGNIFINSAQATNGNIFCNTITPDVLMAASNDCNSVSGTPPMYDIPAVQFHVSGSPALSPGGPSQPVDFSVTNPGSSNEQVDQVTIAVAQDASGNVESTPGDPSTATSGCLASWFTLNGSPVTVNKNVPAGGTIDWTGSASISMTNEALSQDACQNATVGLIFTSN